jgi:hypothetical protein
MRDETVELPAGDDLGADLPDDLGGDGGDDGGYAADLSDAIAEAKGETDGAGSDEPGYSRDIAEAIEEQGAALAQAETARTWETELDGLYRQALGQYGLTPEAAAQQGITVQEATKRLYRAEQILKQNPAEGMAWLAGSYAANLSPEQRVTVAQKVLERLGFRDVDQLAQHERAELQQWRQYQAQQRQAHAEALPRVEQKIEAFGRDPAHPHFGQLRVQMGRIMAAGLANTLEEAYDAAAQRAGLPARGQALAQAHRERIARAKAARTPNTASTRSAPAEDDDGGDMSFRATLAAELAKAKTNGRARL